MRLTEEYDRHYLPARQSKKRAVWVSGKRDYIRHSHRPSLVDSISEVGKPPKGVQVQARECVIELNKYRFGKWIYAIGFCLEEDKKYIARVYLAKEYEDAIFEEYVRINESKAAKKKEAESKEAREAAILAEYERPMK